MSSDGKGGHLGLMTSRLMTLRWKHFVPFWAYLPTSFSIF